MDNPSPSASAVITILLQAPEPAVTVNIKGPETLAQVFEERSKTFASTPFLVGTDSKGDVNFTYGQCRTMAIRTSAALTARFGSIQDASSIAVLSDPSVEYVVLLIAAWYAALPLVLVPSSLPAEVSQALVRAADVRVLLYSAGCKEIALALQKACPELLADGLYDMTSIVTRDVKAASDEQDFKVPSDASRLCVVLSTSGSTTGTSVKAVPLTHSNVIASCRSRDAHWLPELLSPADAVLGWLPLAHVMGFLLDLVNTAIMHGGRYVLCHAQGHALPTTLLNAIATHRPSFVSAVPWLLDAWRNLSLNSPEVLAPLLGLRALQVGGAPLDHDLAMFYLTRHVPLVQSAGMTETSASLFTGRLLPTSVRDRVSLQLAYPLRPHATLRYELLISRANDYEGEEGEEREIRGELVVVDQGTVTNGYLSAAEANASNFENSANGRRFRTGDRLAVQRDNDGSHVVTYIGRVDDTLSLTTGEKVDAAAYESELRASLRKSLPSGATLPVMCLLGTHLPFPLLAVEYAPQIDEEANKDRPASCRVMQEAILYVREPLPIGRKRQVIRALAHAKLLPRIKALIDRLRPSAILVHPTTSLTGAITSAATSISMSQLMTELARVLGVNEATLQWQHTSTFARLGLTSLLAESLAARLGFPPHYVFSYPTPASLFAALSATSNAVATVATPVLNSMQHQGISVIGIACRTAGDIWSPAQLWQALLSGSDLLTGLLSVRFPEIAHMALDSLPPRGGMLSDVQWRCFDRYFFGVGEAEATYMDPRHRMAMELAWEACENAGIAPTSLSGSPTGVFAAFSSDHAGFEEMIAKRIPTDRVSAYSSVGGAGAAAAGRVAYALGLRGPAYVVDAACASSAIALLQAQRYLLTSPPGTFAIVLASQLMLTPTSHVSLMRAGALSPTAHSAPFDVTANGYVRSDGCAAVLLTRSDSAKSAGYNVWCELLGGAITHGGDTAAALTAPSAVAQETAMKGALAEAQVKAEQVSYVESHGTGTRLGDPIEADVLARIYGRRTNGLSSKVIVGALKGQLGHTEAASGLLGLVKLSLCAYHSVLPRNFRFSSLSPLIGSHVASEARLAFPTQERTAWPALQDGTRYAAISNFGFTGTHAHLIFSCPPPSTPFSTASIASPLVIPIAARSKQSVEEQAKRWCKYVSDLPDWRARANACYTAAVHRDHFMLPSPHGSKEMWRAGVVLTQSESSATSPLLAALAQTVSVSNVSPASLALPPAVAFVLAGQGLLMPPGGLHALCKSLSALSVTFADVIARAEGAYTGYVTSTPSCPLPSTLLVEELGYETEVTSFPSCHLLVVLTFVESASGKKPSQAALIAFEMALAALWRSWGVTCSTVLGHSLGEIASASICGVLSVEQAVHMAAAREVALVSAGGKGGMAAILADRATATALVAEVDRLQRVMHGSDSWSIGFAGYNGPTHYVVAGTHEAIATLLALQSTVKRVVLPVTHAFHSPLIAQAAKQWAKSYCVTHDEAVTSSTRMISTLTGAEVTAATLRSMTHWEQHASSPVKFEDALLAATERVQVLLTLSPAASLASMVRRATAQVSPVPTSVDSFDATSGAFSATLGLMQAAVRLFTAGVRVDWRAVYGDITRASAVRLQLDPWLPPYAWSRDRIALPGVEPSLTVVPTGQKQETWAPKPAAIAQLRQHVINGEAIVPAAAQVMFLLQHLPAIAHVDFIAPARVVPLADKQPTLSSLRSDEEIKLQWSTGDGSDAVECAVAHGSAVSAANALVTEAIALLKDNDGKLTEGVHVQQFYTHLRVVQHLAYGTYYRGITELGLSPDRRTVYSLVRRDDVCEAGLPLSVAQLDACFHTGVALLSPSDGPHIPISMSDVAFLTQDHKARQLLCIHRLHEGVDSNGKTACVYVYDAETKTPIFGIRRYTVAPTSADKRLLHHRVWTPTAIPLLPTVAASAWLMFGDGDVCAQYKARLGSGVWSAEANINVADLKAHVRQLLSSVPPAAARMKVLYAWSLRPLAADMEVRAVLQLKCTPLLHVLQALAEHTSSHVVDFYLVTRGAVRGTNTPTSLTHCVAAALQAMVGVGAVELSSDRMHLHTVDLSHSPTNAIAVQNSLYALLDTVLQTSSQFVVGCGGAYLAPKLEPLTRASMTPVTTLSTTSASEQTAVVTGGLGGVGRHLAAWLLGAAPAQLRASRVVLVGRTMPEDNGVKLVADIAELCGGLVQQSSSSSLVHRVALTPFGASFGPPQPATIVTLILRKCDISIEDDVISTMRDVVPHIIVHSAGILRDRALVWMTEEDLQESLGAKACAAWYLRMHAPATSVVVLCSSVSAVLHTAGQTNYAAGNAFLDALADGPACVSVGWGPWLGVGMATNFDQAAARSPCRPMAPQGATAALSRFFANAFYSNYPNFIVADMIAASHAATVSVAKSTTNSMIDPEKELFAALCSVLGRSEAQLRNITRDTPLHEHGLDSLGAMEVRGILTRRSLVLPLRAFRSPSLLSLLTELASVTPTASPILPSPLPPPQGRTAAVAVMSTATPHWLMPVVGDPSTAKHRLVLFNDAGGDPANFRSWASTWTLPDTAVLAVHWPGHTTRSSEQPCKDLDQASATFIAEAMVYLQDRPYAFLGQCIGAYFAYRVTSAVANIGGLRLPSALIAVACPGPAQMGVLTVFTSDPPGALPADSAEQRLVRGLHALTLAIGFTEEDWQRLQSDAKLFTALKADVAMTDVPQSGAHLPLLPCPMLAVLGAVDPVVKRKHIGSWLDLSSSFVHITLPALGHNIQYEGALMQSVASYLPTKFA